MPDGFEFAVKLPLTRLDRVTPFLERALALGDRLGPIRVVVEAARDDGLVSFVTGSTPPGVKLAWDFRHESWDGVAGVVRVGDNGAEPFSYVRLREPPYTDDDQLRSSRRRSATLPTSTSATRTHRRRPWSPSACGRSCRRLGITPSRPRQRRRARDGRRRRGSR